MTSSHGLRTLAEPFWSRDSQQVHRKDEDSNWQNQIHDLQSTEWHEEILWQMQNSGSSVQPWQQSFSQRIRYLDYVPFAETLALMAWSLYSRTENRTYSLWPKAATPDKATLSSVQCSKAYSSSGWPDHRTENRRPPTTHSHWRRSGVGSRGDTQQSLASEKIPVSH